MTITLLIVLSLTLLAYVSFAYRYSRFSPWRATWQGVTLLSQKLTFAALVAFFLADTIIIEDNWPGRSPILIVLLTLIMLEAWATFAGLMYVQKQSRPVSKRQGTGYVEPGDLERTGPHRKR